MEHGTEIKGIQYVVDGAGNTTAVIVSLEEWGELWEDFYDAMVTATREGDKTILWRTLKAELDSEEDIPSRCGDKL